MRSSSAANEEIADPKFDAAGWAPAARARRRVKVPDRRVEGGHLSREGSYHGVTLGIPSAEM